MSDQQTFLTLPSLVRQAMERAAGVNGTEALTRERPVPFVAVTPTDWHTIRDYMIEMQERLNDYTAFEKQISREHADR